MNDERLLMRYHTNQSVANQPAMNDDDQCSWARPYMDSPVGSTINSTIDSAITDHASLSSQQEEIRRLKAELRRVTEERNILKLVAALVYT